jgi:8-oxo-dGTP diphosphatase
MPPIYVEFNFCPLCAAELKVGLIENKERKICPRCDYIHWGEYSVGVGGVLIQKNKGLIVQRAINPGRGRWTIPGGYVDQNEKIEDAIVRELREETGLLTEPVSILGIKDRPEDLPGVKHDIYIVFLLRYLGGELKPDPNEVSQAGFYTPDECQSFNISPLSLHLITKSIERNQKGDLTPGFIRKDGLQIVGALSELYTLS